MRKTPNEKLDVANFHGGIIASAILYDEIAKTRITTEDPDDRVPAGRGVDASAP
jgi:hypothetical protein